MAGYDESASILAVLNNSFSRGLYRDLWLKTPKVG